MREIDEHIRMTHPLLLTPYSIGYMNAVMQDSAVRDMSKYCTCPLCEAEYRRGWRDGEIDLRRTDKLEAEQARKA